MEVAALQPPTLCSPGGRRRIGARSESIERGQLGSVCMSKWVLFSSPLCSRFKLPTKTQCQIQKPSDSLRDLSCGFHFT